MGASANERRPNVCTASPRPPRQPRLAGQPRGRHARAADLWQELASSFDFQIILAARASRALARTTLCRQLIGSSGRTSLPNKRLTEAIGSDGATPAAELPGDSPTRPDRPRVAGPALGARSAGRPIVSANDRAQVWRPSVSTRIDRARSGPVRTGAKRVGRAAVGAPGRRAHAFCITKRPNRVWPTVGQNWIDRLANRVKSYE